jgi:deoxyribose-phosphate aldolase
MYAWISYWSVTVYGQSESDKTDLVRLIAEARTQHVSFGSVCVLPPPSGLSKEALEQWYATVPYVWFPHKEWEEIIPLLEASGINVPDVPLTAVSASDEIC